MRKRSKAAILMLVLVMMLFATGCAPIEDMLVSEPDPTVQANGPMTELEFTNAMDRILNEAINDGTIILGRALDLKRGSILPDEELASLEDSIDKTQKSIDELQALSAPSTYIEQQMKAVKLLADYKEALKNYYAVLETEQYDLTDTCTDAIKSAMASVKMVYGTI